MRTLSEKLSSLKYTFALLGVLTIIVTYFFLIRVPTQQRYFTDRNIRLLGATSKGRILVFERDELMEAAAICRSMTHGEIDDVSVLTNCLDVLAQQIAGAVAAGDWQADELFALVRHSG